MGILEKADRWIAKHFKWLDEKMSKEGLRRVRYMNMALFLVIVTMLLIKTCA